MQLRGEVAAALLAVATGVACCVATAAFADGERGLWRDALASDSIPSPPRRSEEAEYAGPRFLLFASTDVWRHGGFAHGGALWSPHGLDDQGPLLKLTFGGGLYRYVSGFLGNSEVTGRQWTAAILPGWRFVRDKLFVSVFAGVEFQNHQLSPDDPSAGLRGAYAGVRGGIEVWYEPTPATMVAADASLSSIGPSYSARVAGGWRVFEWFYVGPEAQAFAADDNYRQLRLGVHVTGLRRGDFEWSAGLGIADDSDHRTSLYGKLGVFTRR